jgi:hypothetical protein
MQQMAMPIRVPTKMHINESAILRLSITEPRKKLTHLKSLSIVSRLEKIATRASESAYSTVL